MSDFDNLRLKKDFDKRLRLAKDFDDKLRLAKDVASELWVTPKKKKKKKDDEEELLWEEEERRRKQADDEDLEEFLLLLTFILCEIYEMGWKDAEDEVGEVYIGWNRDLETVDAEIDGKTFSQRILESETYEEVERIIDTEAHRDYNAGVYNAAKASGNENILKTWRTMLDDKVRDSHQYLEGVTVGLDDYFYTAGGARALYPGQFGVPEEDINCRCLIQLSVG